MRDELRNLIKECDHELEDIEEILKSLPPLSDERRYFTNYILIKTSGTIEFVYRSIVADYFSELLHNDRIDHFLENKVRSVSMSCTYNNMCKLLNDFDPEWKKQFQHIVRLRDDYERLIISSNSLTYNRHRFSHGKSPSASLNDIKQYYHDLKILVALLDKVINDESKMEDE